MKLIIGFSRPKKWKPFAWLIMKGYNIPYSHVYVKFHSDKYDRDIIYQASHSMVNFMGTTVFLEDNIITSEFEVEIKDDSAKELMQFLIDNAGKPYGIRQCFGMAIVRIADIFGKYIENPFKDGGNTYVCSEVCAYILKQFAGIVVPRDIDDITPKDVFEYLQKIRESLSDGSKDKDLGTYPSN